MSPSLPPLPLSAFATPHTFNPPSGTLTAYHLFTPPTPTPIHGTILLLHGFPDLPAGYRHQIPPLLALGLRVLLPALPGYSPSAAPTSLTPYTLRSISRDLAALAAHLGCDASGIYVLAHDWGGALAWRLALWEPQLVKGLVVVCTPFDSPKPGAPFVPTEDLVSGPLPQFAYQLTLASGEVERRVRSVEEVRGFLNAVYGGRSREGKFGFDATGGVDWGVILSGGLARTTLMSEAELEYYARTFAAGGGMRGALNWYRTRRLNWEDDREIKWEGKVKVPTLFVRASRDMALPVWMSKGMGRHFEDLRTVEVDGTHWVLVQKAEECNKHIGEFLSEQMAREKAGESKL
ncbi:hypothetical protein VE03_02374 [Pseudogymnoascus sp. 23342-1-I1]|nr:hypothetical protein VE03_02374 [Pseudogymnoascus sp. 23342-1-I1]